MKEWIKWGLVATLAILLLWPFILAGLLAYTIYFLYTQVREFLAMSKCTSLNPATGLCDWGSDCLCWHIHMQQHAANGSEAETADMFECYPSNSATNFSPLSESMKDGIVTTYIWEEKVNPGIVEEGTQPIEVDDEEEAFPGFSKHGG